MNQARIATMSKTMNVNGIDFRVIGEVKSEQLGKSIPMLDIPMMSDERWQELCVESARKHFVKEFGNEPASDEEALKWERERIAITEKANKKPLNNHISS